MRRRHPLPKIWLMTDSRVGDLSAAIGHLPRGAGIIFRHYELPPRKRRLLFRRVKKQALARGHMLLLADKPRLAQQWGADGAHNRSRYQSRGIRTAAVHNAREAALAKRIGADLIFVSPVFATRSHPGAQAIGAVKLGQIAAMMRGRAIALGGMTAKRAQSLFALKLYGWAAIDAFRI